MKSIIINSLILLLGSSLYGQASLQATSGTQIICSGSAQIVLQDISWNNNGTVVPAQSILSFTGNAAGQASMEDALFNPYHNIVVDRPGNELILQSDLDLEGNFTFQSGHLHLNNQTLTFLTETGSLDQEDATRHAYSPIGGQMIAGKLLSFPDKENVGNLGAIITAGGNLSYTEVRRGHGLYFTPGGHSISRWYQINSVAGAGVPTAIRFTYFDHELNGLEEGQLQVWHSTNYGLSWSPVEISARSTTHNWVQVFGSDFSGLFTLALPSGSLSPEGGALGQAGTTPEAESSLMAYPNPLVDQLQVELEAPTDQDLELQWLDAAGRLVKTERIAVATGKNTYTFDLATLPAGTYYLKVEGAAYTAVPLVKMP